VNPQESGIRHPAVAGTFYPDDPAVLNKELDALLGPAELNPTKGNVVGMILPHAGYAYSGYTASLGYKLLAKKPVDTVVIVSPSHREYFDGISVYNGTAYRTPLGDLKIDEEVRTDLLKEDAVIVSSDAGHRGEHAIEVQLPFIQKVMGGVKIVPIVMGEQRREYCFHLGERLAAVLRDRSVLLIASSDLSHYHPYEEAESMDAIIIGDVAQFDYEKMMNDLESERAEACGGGPMVAVLDAARRLGASRAEILYHCNSGDITGDRHSVVGYLSAALLSPN
jgi:AmmeMemoRadiSam system protein B